MLALRRALPSLFAVALAACAAGAQFHSRTGADYPRVAVQALPCQEAQIELLTKAGGVPIGTIDAKAWRVDATDDDLDEKAAKEAADHGGTHIVLTTRGLDTMTYTQPGQTTTDCTHDGHEGECQTTTTDPTTSTVTKPTARYVVFRVPADGWAKLPELLRPAAQR
jgi:hypothetical protein